MQWGRRAAESAFLFARVVAEVNAKDNYRVILKNPNCPVLKFT